VGGTVAGTHVSVGSGERHVLAVHGWFGSSRGWGPLPDFLDGSAHTYVFTDLRGYGDRRDVAGDLGWDRFSVIGHSMGAKVAHQVLLQAPDRVHKLIGLNPVPAAGVPMDAQAWDLFSGAAADAGNRAVIIDFTTGGKLTATFIQHIVQHSLNHCDVTAFGAYLPAWAKSDFTSQVKPETGTPVKVIVGETDQGLPAELMKQTWLTYFPEAELTVLANAGHYPMFETPVALATSIEEFLGRE
jgi:pimeloyl-ACP methyl ester carboxylesterase